MADNKKDPRNPSNDYKESKPKAFKQPKHHNKLSFDEFSKVYSETVQRAIETCHQVLFVKAYPVFGWTQEEFARVVAIVESQKIQHELGCDRKPEFLN